jgi:hypothetical protein
MLDINGRLLGVTNGSGLRLAFSKMLDNRVTAVHTNVVDLMQS